MKAKAGVKIGRKIGVGAGVRIGRKTAVGVGARIGKRKIRAGVGVKI